MPLLPLILLFFYKLLSRSQLLQSSASGFCNYCSAKTNSPWSGTASLGTMKGCFYSLPHLTITCTPFSTIAHTLLQITLSPGYSAPSPTSSLPQHHQFASIFQSQFRLGFLSLGSTDIWGQTIVCCGGSCPGHWRISSSIPDLYPRDASSISLPNSHCPQ